MEGDLTDKRIANGVVTCPDDHSWQISEEILRFDKEKSDEPMQYNERPRTGFPGEVEEQERLEFLPSLQEFVEGLHFEDDQLIKITGDAILFLKYLSNNNANFLIVNTDEGILRQLQEIAARKRMYDQMSFIRAEDINLIGSVNTIQLFPSSIDQKLTNTLFIGFIDQGREIWAGEDVVLRAHLT
jgi:hypothetical protein